MELSLLRSDASLASEDHHDDVLSEDAIIDVLKSINEVKTPHAERVEVVRHCLHDTSSDVVRNQAALALIGLVAREAASDIVRVLRDGDFAGSSGTLLFALNEIEAEIPLDILTRTVVSGSYEARNEAMFALEQGRVAPAGGEGDDRVIAEVSPLLDSDDGATAEVAAALLAHLRGGKLKSAMG